MKNNGPNAATNVTLGDLLPAGLSFVAAGTAATQGTYDGVAGVWTIGTLAGNATATLTIQALVAASTPQTNTAAITHSDQFDPIRANNSASG